MKIKTVGIINGCSGHWHQAAKNSGFEVLWDYEPSWQRQVIEHNFKNDIILSAEADIFRMKKPDLICGSPPCTGFTPAAGKTFRPELECNNYVVRFGKLVAKIKPKCFVMEEVKNFCLIENNFFKEYIKAIKSHYNFTYDIINAFDYGSPQNRNRFVICGFRKPKKPDHNLLYGSESIPKEYPLERLKGIKPVEKITPAKNIKGNWGHLSTPHRRMKRTLKTNVPCHTLTGFCTRDILMPNGRYLAWNEAAILMGFPPSYGFKFLCKSKRSLAIGRGVPIELAKNMLLNMRSEFP